MTNRTPPAVVPLAMWLTLLLFACAPPPLARAEAEVSHPEGTWGWPHPRAPIDLLIPPSPAVDRALKVYIDPGHGDGENTGNRGVRCQSEEEEMLALADDLAARLPDFGPFEVRSARPEGARTRYSARVAQANDWEADVFLSLHSDARGSFDYWEPFPAWSCIRNDDEPGFAILVSDEGGPATVGARASLADAVASRMAQSGFGPYVGEDYGQLYDRGEVPGTWLDRRGLMMLRRPNMPSVIIETHNAFDLPEVRRWDEDRTRDAFARAVAHAVLDVVTD